MSTNGLKGKARQAPASFTEYNLCFKLNNKYFNENIGYFLHIAATFAGDVKASK
jgi:hypothetical protein